MLAGIIWLTRDVVPNMAARQATASAAAALPADMREGFDPSPKERTYPTPNDATRRLAVMFRAGAVSLIVIAQVLIVLGSYGQIGTNRATLFMKIASPFLLVFLAPGGSTGAGRITNAQSYYIPPDVVSFMLILLALSVIPVLLILWLTRSSGDKSRARQRRPRERAAER